MDWSTRRRALYIIAIGVLFSTFSIYSFRDVLFPQPSCFDNKKNGLELGVDCGGVCSLRCTQEVFPLVVRWSKAIQTGPNTFDLVAMVANKNVNNAAHELGITFSIYDETGHRISVVRASSTQPIDGDFPVVVQNISLPDGKKEVTAEVIDGAHFAVPSTQSSPILRVPEIIFEKGETPRVYAQVVNNRQYEMRSIKAVVLLYDEDGNVYAVNTTVIPTLAGEESKKVPFVWPSTYVREPVQMKLYPIIDPFLYN